MRSILCFTVQLWKISETMVVYTIKVLHTPLRVWTIYAQAIHFNAFDLWYHWSYHANLHATGHKMSSSILLVIPCHHPYHWSYHVIIHTTGHMMSSTPLVILYYNPYHWPYYVIIHATGHTMSSSMTFAYVNKQFAVYVYKAFKIRNTICSCITSWLKAAKCIYEKKYLMFVHTTPSWGAKAYNE